MAIFLIAMCCAVGAMAETQRKIGAERERSDALQPPVLDTSEQPPAPQPEAVDETPSRVPVAPKSLTPGAKEWCERFPDSPGCQALDS